MNTKTVAWQSILVFPSIWVGACDIASNSPSNDIELPVERFLVFYFQGYGRGLPDESQLAELASFVTPELLNLFEAAVEGEDCYLEKINYQGPGPIQGDLFSSLFEGGTSATYRQIAQETNTAIFEVEWINDSPVAERPFAWKDQILLVRTADGWLIDDFVHQGTWEFMMKGNVSQILGAVSEECVG